MTWRVLDLFCGAGGAAMGLHRAWPDAEIIGVDIKLQKHYPFEFVLADAMTFPLEGYDFIWASPPCQGYSRMLNLPWMHDRVYPMLIPQVRARLQISRADWCIENVEDAPLLYPFILCGWSMGLPIYRHRRFESNRLLLAPPHIKHTKPIFSSRYLNKRYGASGGVIGIVGHTSGVGTKRAADALGIDWMIRQELCQAVPPAYSEFIARQIREYKPELSCLLSAGV